jgi:diguanylate cyclase (GGDEF)-like protein
MLEHDAFSLSPFGIVATDNRGCILNLNPAAIRLFDGEAHNQSEPATPEQSAQGQSTQELSTHGQPIIEQPVIGQSVIGQSVIGQSIITWLPALFDHNGKYLAPTWSQQRSRKKRTAIQRSDNRRIAVDMEIVVNTQQCYYLFLSDNEPPQTATEAALPLQFEQFLDNTPDFVYLKVIDGARHSFVGVSQSMATLCGFYDWREMIGLDDFDAFPTAEAHKYYSFELEILGSGQERIFRDTYLGLDGAEHWISSLKTPIFDKTSGRAISLFGISRNIDEQVAMEGKIVEQARRDPLTGALNRRTLSEDIRTQISLFNRHHRTFSALLFDIDYFKTINDNHGHGVGDKVLQRVVNAIAEHCRDTDSLYRVGGDEFMLLMPSATAGEAASFANRILQLLRNYDFGDLHSITLSIGAAEYLNGESETDLYTRCDNALYLAKRNGRNQVCSAAQHRDNNSTDTQS